MKTIIEAFKIKMVEPIKFTTPAKRDTPGPSRAPKALAHDGRTACR
jgi:hypothetical protein